MAREAAWSEEVNRSEKVMFNLRVPCEHQSWWKGPLQCEPNVYDETYIFNVSENFSYHLTVPQCYGHATVGEACELFSKLTGHALTQVDGQGAYFREPPHVYLRTVMVGYGGRRFVLEHERLRAWDDFLISHACKWCKRVPTEEQWRRSRCREWPGWDVDTCSKQCEREYEPIKHEKWRLEFRREARLKRAKSKTNKASGRKALEEFLTIGAINERAGQ